MGNNTITRRGALALAASCLTALTLAGCGQQDGSTAPGTRDHSGDTAGAIDMAPEGTTAVDVALDTTDGWSLARETGSEETTFTILRGEETMGRGYVNKTDDFLDWTNQTIRDSELMEIQEQDESHMLVLDHNDESSILALFSSDKKTCVMVITEPGISEADKAEVLKRVSVKEG